MQLLETIVMGNFAVLVLDRSSMPLTLFNNQIQGLLRRLHTHNWDDVSATAIVILRDNLSFGITTKESITMFLIEVVQALENLCIELPDVIEVQLRIAVEQGGRQGILVARTSQETLVHVYPGWAFNLEKHVDCLHGKPLEADHEVPLTIWQIGWIVGNEARIGQGRRAANGVKNIGCKSSNVKV
jgi:hypothetical protein